MYKQVFFIIYLRNELRNKDLNKINQKYLFSREKRLQNRYYKPADMRIRF